MPKVTPKIKMPKIISVSKGKPKNDVMQMIMLVLIIVLVGFTVFYAIKIMRDSNQVPERFTQVPVADLHVKLIYSDTCPHCVRFKPTFNAVMEAKDKLFVGKSVVFTMTPAAEASDFSAFTNDGIPVVVFMKGGDSPDKVVTKVVGNMAQDAFISKIKEVLA